MSALPADIVAQMLAAAKDAAGTRWNSFAADVTQYARNLHDDSQQVATDFAAGRISRDDAKMLFDDLADEAAMIANAADEALKLAAQDAANAAAAILWKAILASV